MKLLFENVTKCSKEMYNEFLEFHNKNNFKNYNVKNIIYILIIIYIIIFNIIYRNWHVVIILVVSIAGLFIYKEYIQKRAPKKELKNSKIRKQEQITFKFYKWYFTVEKNEILQTKYYIKMYKAAESERYFYIYLDKTHSFILDKNGFTKGNALEFSKFAESKFKRKFKRYTNK